jgi:hypothetical protein
MGRVFTPYGLRLVDTVLPRREIALESRLECGGYGIPSLTRACWLGQRGKKCNFDSDRRRVELFDGA